MTRVLLITHNFLDVNSSELYRLIGTSDGIELTVAVPQQNPGVVDDKGRAFNIELVRQKNPADYLAGWEPADLKRVLRQARPEIVQCMSEAFSPYVAQVAWLALRHARKAKVLFYAYENMPISSGLRMRLKTRPAWMLMAGGAAATQTAVDVLRNVGFPSDKPIPVIPYGIGSTTFYPMDRLACKREFGLTDRPVVGYVGRLAPEKGIGTIMAAMTELPGVDCLLIGRGPLSPEARLWSEAPSLAGRVHMRDGADPVTLGRLMNAMDVLALPSVRTAHWMEQYGRVLVEAMACGTPVVGTESGAIPEVIGDAGAVVPEYDWRGLAREIRCLTDDMARWQDVSRRAVARAPRFGDRAMSESLVRFYHNLMRRAA